MRKRLTAALLCLCMMLTLLPGTAYAAVGELLGNSRAENQALLEQLEALTGQDGEAIQALLEQYGLLDEDGNLDIDQTVELDGDAYTLAEIEALLDDPDADLSRVGYVDGVPIALGTDGVSSNNNQDMFEEMKFAAVLHNGVTRDPLALLPQDVLAMATREGAKALGRQTGRIAPGYVADLILVDFTRPHLTPCHSVMDNLVYAAHGSDVVMNMARGKIIYKDGTFLTLDLEKIQAEVKSYALPRLFGDGKTW